MSMGRTENNAIFEDTRKIYQTDPELAAAIRASNHMQEVILESDEVKAVPPAICRARRSYCFQETQLRGCKRLLNLSDLRTKFCLCNQPRGGVAWGSTAQEECLCRCSTLYANLTVREVWQPFYEAHREQHNQLYNDDCIYTPDVVVFKTDVREPELMHPDDWRRVNIITCAAPNLRPDRNGNMQVHINNKELFDLHVKRMRRILTITAMKENAVVILGAYGCGAFRNPPGVVASAMRQVIEEFRYHFRVIEFAVYCSPRDEQNYQVFNQILSGL